MHIKADTKYYVCHSIDYENKCLFLDPDPRKCSLGSHNLSREEVALYRLKGWTVQQVSTTCRFTDVY